MQLNFAAEKEHQTGRDEDLAVNAALNNSGAAVALHPRHPLAFIAITLHPL